MTPAPPDRWLLLNFKIGAFSVGAASRLLLFEEAIVRQYAWMSGEEFREVLTLAQMLPGPNLVNLSTCAGYRLCSRSVTLAGLFLLIAPGSLAAVLVYLWVPLTNPSVAQVFRGCAIGAFLLAGRFVWNLARGISASAQPLNRSKLIGRYLLAAVTSGLIVAGLPLMPIIAVGALSCLVWEFAV